MDDDAIDAALIRAAFTLAAEQGWETVSVAAAAREAGIPLEKSRGRFVSTGALLMRFGRLADAAALEGITADGSPRDRLFDLLMRRFDALQAHRDGVRAVMRAAVANPLLGLELAAATALSMSWMLEGASISASGWRGTLRVKGLTAVWLYAVRAWDRDQSADLSGTMAALDRGLTQAEWFGGWLAEDGATRAPAPFPDVVG